MGTAAGIKLSRTERNRLKLFLRKTKDSRRYRAALGVLLRAQGKSADEVRIALGVTQKQVFKWCSRYRESGINGITLKKPPGRPATLGKKAKKRINILLNDQPRVYGYLKGRWVLRDNEDNQVSATRMLRPAFCLRAGQRVDADAPILPRAEAA